MAKKETLIRMKATGEVRKLKPKVAAKTPPFTPRRRGQKYV